MCEGLTQSPITYINLLVVPFSVYSLFSLQPASFFTPLAFLCARSRFLLFSPRLCIVLALCGLFQRRPKIFFDDVGDDGDDDDGEINNTVRKNSESAAFFLSKVAAIHFSSFLYPLSVALFTMPSTFFSLFGLYYLLYGDTFVYFIGESPREPCIFFKLLPYFLL